MKTHELRQLSEEELSGRIEQMQADYIEITEAVRSGKQKNHAQLKDLRSAIARAKTVLIEARRAASLKSS